MADTTPTDQLNTLIASTLRTFEKSGIPQDNIYYGEPLFAFLNAKGAKQTMDGGREIQVNLRYGKNTNAMSYAGSETLNADAMEGVGHAIYSWKQYATGIFVDNATMLKNRSKEAIYNIWADEATNAIDSLKELMFSDLYGNGTGNSGKDMLGLEGLISDTGTLGGIDRDSDGQAWWRAQVFDKTADSELDVSMLRNAVNTVRGPSGDPQKSGVVDLIIMPQDLYESWESLYENKLQFAASDLTLGKLGFETLKYKGAEVTWSSNCPAGTIYLISSKYMGLRVMSGRDFKFTGAEDVTVSNKVDGKRAFVLWMGQLIASNCRRLGKLTNVTVDTDNS